MGPHSASEPEPVLFSLERFTDASGISGTGRVLDGVVFHTGQVVVCWRSHLHAKPSESSIAIYPTVQAFLEIHVLPHGREASRITFLHGSCSELESCGPLVQNP
jgi:hypothetical protein